MSKSLALIYVLRFWYLVHGKTLYDDGGGGGGGGDGGGSGDSDDGGGSGVFTVH